MTLPSGAGLAHEEERFWAWIFYGGPIPELVRVRDRAHDLRGKSLHIKTPAGYAGIREENHCQTAR